MGPGIRIFSVGILTVCAACSSDAIPPDPDFGPRDGDALYADQTEARLPPAAGRFTMDVAFGDFDDDGDADLLVAVEFGQNRLLLNDGTGRFGDATAGRLPPAAHDSEDIAVADFDGDGDLDAIVVSEDDRTNEVYWNDGTATFTAGELPVSGISNAVVVGDIDDDGDVDVLIGNAGAEAVLMNDGAGGFTDESAERIPVGATGITQDLELGDMDGDGDLDLLTGNENGNRLLLNDGTGAFEDVTDTWIPTRSTAEETREVDLADVDGDGDLDAFFANTASSFPAADPANRLLLNEGDRFVDVSTDRLPVSTQRSFDGEFWDLDGDGDMDIVTGSLTVSGGQAVMTPFRALLNDGTGHFMASGFIIFPPTALGFGFDSEMADVDGDGVLDIYLASRGTQDRLLVRR